MSLSTQKTHFQKGIKKIHTWLQEAIEIEHATIPPYFTAWLSIKEGYNQESREIIKSVLIEEMLHLTLAANILNAVGGHPDLIHPKFVPRYPHKLPHSGDRFQIHIEKFSIQALKTFEKIERPEPKGARPRAKQFKTIGQFYAAVGKHLDDLCEKYGEKKVFSGNARLQIQHEDYYGSGAIVVVTGRDTAHQAIATIVDQGEGAHEGIFDPDKNILGRGSGMELAHYFRFMEISHGRHYRQNDTLKSGPTGARMKVDFEKIYSIKKDLHRDDYPKDCEARKALDDFADSYGELLKALHEAFNGHRSLLTAAIARMFLLRNQAVALMRTPIGKGAGTLGLDFTQSTRKKRTVRD